MHASFKKLPLISAAWKQLTNVHRLNMRVFFWCGPTPPYRSRLASLHVDKPHHDRQFQEAPGVCREGELCEQQVRALPAAQRGEWVRHFS